MSVLALPILFILPGYILARALWRDSNLLSIGERLFIPLALSILISVWLGLVLAEFGIFSLTLVTALVVILSAVIFLSRRNHLTAWPLIPARLTRADGVLLAACVVAILLVGRPAENIIGANDAGTYLNTGFSIAQTGSLAIRDPLIPSLGDDPSKQFFWSLVNPYMLYKAVRMPGFFVHDAASGIVLPQFLHLYPVYLALFFSALGLSGGLYATPFIGILGSLAAYLLAKSLFGRRVALVAFCLLIINVPQFWFARYPVSEAFTQFLLLTGIYSFTCLVQDKGKSDHREGEAGRQLDHAISSGLALLAGLAFGEIFLTRLDALLLFVPIGVYLLAVIITRGWRIEQTVFFGALSVLLVHAFAHVWNFAPNYIYFELTHVLRTRNIIYTVPTAEEFLKQPVYLAAMIGLGILGLLALFGLSQLTRRIQFTVPRVGPRIENLARWLGIVSVIVGFIYIYFIAPHVTTLYAFVGGETPAGREANFVKIGWYLSPIGMVLAVIGLARIIHSDLSRTNLFFISVALLFTYFYGEELYSNPHYIYTMRHYIPLVIPALIIFAARALDGVFNRPDSRLLGQSAQDPRGLALLWSGRVALAAWLAYNAYAMGIIDGTRKDGFALRLPFVATPVQVGGLRVEPFDKSIAGFGELDGAVKQIQALAKMIPPNAVTIFSNNRDEPAVIATPLEYIFERDALVSVFNNPNGEKIAASIDDWRARGREVILFYGVNGGKLALPPRYTLEPFGHFSFDVPQWSFQYQYMPRAPWRINLNYAAYRVVPATTIAPAYPMVIDFGGDDQRYTRGGFLERPPGALTRWSGVIVDTYNDTDSNPTGVTATLRLPLTPLVSNLKLTLTVRAPSEGARMVLRSGDREFGSVLLTQEFRPYQFDLPRDALVHDDTTFQVSISSDTLRDPEGRFVGVEFQSAQVTANP